MNQSKRKFLAALLAGLMLAGVTAQGAVFADETGAGTETTVTAPADPATDGENDQEDAAAVEGGKEEPEQQVPATGGENDQEEAGQNTQQGNQEAALLTPANVVEMTGAGDETTGEPVVTSEITNEAALREALNNAPSEGVITLPAGTISLSSTLNIDKSITLQGAVDTDGNPTTILKGKSTSNVNGIDITGPADVTLKNIHFADFGGAANYNDVIRAGTNDDLFEGNLTVENCKLTQFGKNGITVKGGTAYIKDVYINVDNEYAGTSRTPNGIQIDMGATGTITDTEIIDSLSQNDTWAATGILTLRGGSTTATNVTFTDCQNGFMVTTYYDDDGYSTPATSNIQNSTFVTCTSGVVGDDVDVTASDNLWVVETGEQFQTAVKEAAAGDTIQVNADITLTEKVEITQDILINGNSHQISGNTTDKGVYFEITSGTFDLFNATLTDFGSNVTGGSGDAVIKVPATAAADTHVQVTDVNIKQFTRSAYDIRSGSFVIDGGTITCGNDLTGETDTVLTKGILAGLGTNKVSGLINEVIITNSTSNYEKWSSSGIEIYNNADVDILDCEIKNGDKGIHVDNYYGTADVTVDIQNTGISAEEEAVQVFSKQEPTGKATVIIYSGDYTGDVEIVVYDDETETSQSVNNTDKNTITIAGGTFTTDPSAFVPDGYKVTSSNGNFIVSVKEEKPEEPEEPSYPPVPDGNDDDDNTGSTGGSTGSDKPVEMPENGFGTDENGDTFFYENGELVTGWVKDGDTWYYMDKETGAMNTEDWVQVNGTWYNFDEDGSMNTGWEQVNGTWYYMAESGAMTTGWQKVDGSWYYMQTWGGMTTGWQQVNGTWYYLKESGAMATGWQQIGGTWYYLKDWGGMATGWQEVNGKWYYFYASGAMAADTTIDGYTVDASGAWVE